MGKLSSWLIAISIFLALAVGYRVTCASEHLNTGLYDELQGPWHISAVHLDSEEVDFSSNATDVDVVEDKIYFVNPGKEFSEFNELGGLRIIIDEDKLGHIAVFWYEGLYRLTGKGAELVLKYNGQGVEGVAASNWTYPEDFVKRPLQDHVHIELEKSNTIAKKAKLKTNKVRHD